MNCSSNELNSSGGTSTHLNAYVDGSADALNTNLVNRSVLKERNCNENNNKLSPLSSKAALNNSKLLASSASDSNTCQNSTTVAGSANLSASKNKSSAHGFHIDSEVDHIQQQQKNEKHGIEAKDEMNDSGVNKSSNTFVGLTEFDEAKIPELPGDLNPNIEEQYSVTFEKCFVQPLKSNQDSKEPHESKADKPHILLPTEVDVTSSDNEIFADCDDEKDPLASTFAESMSLNVTTDLESYQSAYNTLNSNTMDNIADITLEAEGQTLSNIRKVQVYEKSHSEQTQFEVMDVDEPMDIDMSATMQIIHNTSNNIQHVENVLQHAENILQHLEEKKPLEELDAANSVLQKQTDFVTSLSQECSSNQDGNPEIKQSQHELSLNKNIELPVIKVKSFGRECSIENINQNVSEENSSSNINLSNDVMNSSTISNSSAKSAVDSKTETKLNSTLNLNISIHSQKSSPPSSPSFPMKATQSSGFPRSPKAKSEKQTKSAFLEKSDYSKNIESQTVEKQFLNNVNGNCVVESTPNTISNNLNCSSGAQDKMEDENSKRRTFAVVTTTEEQVENNVELRNKRRTFSIDALGEGKNDDETRRTSSVETNKTSSKSLLQTGNTNTSIATTESQNDENMSNLNPAKTDINIRRTFNLHSEELLANSSGNTAGSNTSSEPMEIDDPISQNSIMPLAAGEEQTIQISTLHTIREKSESPTHLAMQQKSQSPTNPLQEMESSSLPIKAKSQSPTSPTVQPKSQLTSPPTIQASSQSPSLPINQDSTQISSSPPTITQNMLTTSKTPESSIMPVVNIKQELISPSTSYEATSPTFASQPLATLIKKRPSIRDARACAADILSAKEESNTKVKDEKDVYVENSPPSIEEVFTGVTATSTTLTNSSGFPEFDQTSSSSLSVISNGEQQTKPQLNEDEFNGNNLILNPSDFDYLLTKGNNNAPVDRSSLLLKFDPLLGVPVPIIQGQPQLQRLQISTNTNNPLLSPTLEEDEHNESNHSFVIDTKTEASAKLKARSQEVKEQLQLEQQVQQNKRQLIQGANKKNATMSVDVIKDMSLDNDCNKTFENSNSTKADEKQIDYKMDELEKKIKNEVLKTEDIEKKLKDAEQREEALIKRITEKDKTIAKMNGVIEAYEKAIAELIAEKEQLTQNYETQLAEVKADRDSNYHHLTSLETTFSDLHVKYEKSKEMTCQLKESEEALQAEKRKNLENLHLQEQRYDKMKKHAMQQLEIANKKLESLTREHAIEITKLKALLKKEEIARSSINEQLVHKTKENAELVKICDELISGQEGSNFAFEPYDPKKH